MTIKKNRNKSAIFNNQATIKNNIAALKAMNKSESDLLSLAYGDSAAPLLKALAKKRKGEIETLLEEHHLKEKLSPVDRLILCFACAASIAGGIMLGEAIDHKPNFMARFMPQSQQTETRHATVQEGLEYTAQKLGMKPY